MALECPQCKSPVAREGQRFCYRCGHDLRKYYESLSIEIKDMRSQSASLSNETKSGGISPAEQAAAEPEEAKQTPESQITEVTAETHLDRSATDRKALLRVLLPTGDVFDREISRAETQIGKGPRNDIVIADPAVSTAHALLRNDNGNYTIADLGSRNGTYLNGERIIDPRPLNHGDVVGVGLSKLTFRLSSYTETAAISPTQIIQASAPARPPVTESALASALVADGLVQRGDVERLRESDSEGRRLYRALVEEGLVQEEAIRDLMSRIFQIEIIDLDNAEVDKAVAKGIPPKLARDQFVFAVQAESEGVLLAVADPTDLGAIEEVKREIGKEVVIRLATRSEIFEQVDRHFGPRLIGVLPSGEKLEYFVSQKEVEIGKASHNHIVLADPTVSNTHAVLMVRDGGFSLVDLGSRNGTYINGERLGAHARTLRHGDTIQLGQTVLTFRNRAETQENVTATLSAAAIEEVRRKAQIVESAQRGSTVLDEGVKTPPVPFAQIQPPTNITPQPFAAVQAVSPVEATPEAIESGEGDDKKKKKKKKKKPDERLKAAYIGGLSRIIAQVIGILLSVGLALYIANRSMRQDDKPIETTAKGKPKIKIAASGTSSKIAGPLGRYQASGAAFIPDTDRIYFIVNDSPQLFWMQINETGQVPNTEAKSADIKSNVTDAEGITYDGHFFYIVGSQSRPGAAEGNAIARFLFDPATDTVRDEPEILTGLRELLIEGIPELKDLGSLDKNNGGLNVEGIAWDKDKSRLLLGLRSPVQDGKALLIPITLTDPRKMTLETLQIGPSAIKLSLENLGIRDIQFDDRSHSFFIIAGPSTSGGGFSLWQWFANEEQQNGEPNPRKLADLTGMTKPEGVSRVKLGNRDFIFILDEGNNGSYKKIDITETP